MKKTLLLPELKPLVPGRLDLRGLCCLELYRPVHRKSQRKEKVGEYTFRNDITNEGKNLIFDTFFNAASQITTWYVGLIDNASYSALNAADVMNSHSGWIELTAYSQSTRVVFASGASSSQTVTNSTPAVFDFTGSATVQGIFITSGSAKGGTTGKLWSTALLSPTVPVSNGDELRFSYSVSA